MHKRKIGIALTLCLLLSVLGAAAQPLPETGSTLFFGRYEQDNILENGSEPIEWIVLDTNEELQQIFLISRFCLDTRIYYPQRVACSWATSTLRQWMNDDFLNAAFTEEEQSRIVLSTVDHHNPHGLRGAGSDTQDKLYLLSRVEVLRYMPTEADRLAWPTEYAKAQGCTVGERNGCCRWWLRTPGARPCDMCGVRVNGRVSAYGMQDVDWETNTIRPVLWLNCAE